VSRLRVAIVADYLNQHGGAEWLVAVLHTMFPEAPVFTPIVDRESLWSEMADADIRVSWMQRLPGLKHHFRKYFLLFPLAVEGFDLSEYDLVLSSSCAFGKGAKARPGAVHVCYCHTPPRFVWDYDNYVRRERLGAVSRALLPPMVHIMKRWDLATVSRPDHYLANSRAVAGRIRKYYGREATVVGGPVNCRRFRPAERIEPYFLVVSRLVPYKRIDLAVDAFNRLGLPLRIVGDGPDRATLEERAGPTVSFLGRASDRDVERMLGECQALVFPGLEDFGLTPLEANASGRPVLAFRGGGVLDTVVDGATGILFDEQSPESLLGAVERFRTARWDPVTLRRHAERFDVAAFKERIFGILAEAAGVSLEKLTG
jgi:glycosyltransferase involved in cell wall biosynthesis